MPSSAAASASLSMAWRNWQEGQKYNLKDRRYRSGSDLDRPELLGLDQIVDRGSPDPGYFGGFTDTVRQLLHLIILDGFCSCFCKN